MFRGGRTGRFPFNPALSRLLYCLSYHFSCLTQYCRAYGDYIRRGLDCQLDLLDHNTVTLRNYKLVRRYRYFTHFAIYYVYCNTCRVFSLRLYCRLSSGILTRNSSLQLTYIAGEHGCAYCCVILVTRHVIFTVPLPLARPPCCLRRHTLLSHGCLANVVNKRHIAYSMHVTISLGIPSLISQERERRRKQLNNVDRHHLYVLFNR
jgi:hypothetical protein